MPIPSSIIDLSTTPSSNSPAGTDPVGSSLDDYLRAIQSILKDAGQTLYTAAGTANALTVTASPAPASYSTGYRVWFKAASANTAAVTINVNGLGAKSLVNFDGTAILPQAIQTGAVICAIYDGTNFLAVNLENVNHVQTWTTAGRPATPSSGMVGYNTDLVRFEGYSNGAWGALGGGATGGGTDAAFYENDAVITQNVTVGQSAFIAGITVTIASPAVFTLANHGFVAGSQIKFSTTGALPTGLAIDTVYYVIATGLTSSAFQVSATSGGSAVNTSGSQSGVHSVAKIKNAGAFGPITVADGVTVTVPNGSTYTVV
jgi:hypothetical protein